MRRALTVTALSAALTAGLAAPAATATTAIPVYGVNAALPQPHGLQAAANDLVAAGQPGVIIMSRRGGRVAHATAGVADQATGARMDPRLHVRVASVTKTFTATVLLQLVAERKVSLNDTVDRWLPGLVRGNGNDGREITVRDLLGHTSGLAEYVLDPRIRTEPRRDWKPEELVAIALEQAPSRTATYSNTNYILAGMIIEKAGGHTFAAELRDRILRPLGLRHTSLPTDRFFPGPYVHGYWGDYGDVSTEVSPSSGWTSGGVISTVDDVARFHRALFTGRLLPRKLQREMTTTHTVKDGDTRYAYGLGVAKERLSCGIAWGHDGGWPGYRTWTYTSADGKRQAVITYNQSSAELEAQPRFQAALKKAAEKAFCG
ncbi:serine hydrolase domain-containing protein [Actinomadura hibisca]|uniref:serine hydrolase domain-containing protein n=1 Tax=Actinomadura hibisca TaxID=68565 RepID=UPI00082D4DDC|nr:serine hydrolase domain-containing protein [Actinomadura hibisca]